MSAAIQRVLATQKNEVTRYSAALATLSPQATLERGYAILRTPSKEVVEDASTLKSGDLLEGMVAKGTFVASVVGSNPSGSFLEPKGNGD